ncbi:hypothetical protein, partial [Hyphomonas atlantica]|uniref:hypothetical protein n=1 Tax=Hyphomonas atlantica TaxID=1280948 RepID=UPI003514D83C
SGVGALAQVDVHGIQARACTVESFKLAQVDFDTEAGPIGRTFTFVLVSNIIVAAPSHALEKWAARLV